MPRNNKLKPVQLPMKLKFNEGQKTCFINNLDSINVELLDCPTTEQLLSYLPQFITATWAEAYNSDDKMSIDKKIDVIRDAFAGKALPTALETINLVFRISGISIQEVTHILRHRMASFSADCSGDKWWSEKDALVPASIQYSDGDYPGGQAQFNSEGLEKNDFFGRYREIVRQAKQLYCDMIDSKQISIMDARYILPRCLSTFYYMRMNFKDAIAFIKQRIDRQIQPETDNIIAYKMYIEIVKKIPLAYGLVDFDEPSHFYIKMARTGKATNLYFPEQNSDKFEWNEDDFIYQAYRNELNGTRGAGNHFEAVAYCLRYELKLAETRAEDNIVKLRNSAFMPDNVQMTLDML